MDQPITTSFKLQGQKPLDAKNISKSLNTLIEALQQNPLSYFNFYKGLKIYLQDEGFEIIWEEVDLQNSSKTILEEDFLYPSNSFYADYDYSGKEFNFFYTNDIGNLSGDYGISLITDNKQNYI